MTYQMDEYLRLLEQVRREKRDLNELEARIRQALGLPEYRQSILEKVVKWLLYVLIERPIQHLVDVIFNWLDQWRKRRKNP